MQLMSRHHGESLVGKRRLARGFTMVELIITVSVAAVLLAIAVPSFRNIILSNKLTTTANEVIAAINVARMEAIKSNAVTQFCGAASNGSDTLGAACKQPGEVYALINGAANAVRAGTPGINPPIVLTSMTAVRFGGQGLGHPPASTAPYDGLIADISTSAMSTDNHRCVRMVAGSILATTTTSAACPK